MVDIKAVLKELTKPLTISGYESLARQTVEKIATEHFDELRIDSAGNYMLIKHAKKENAMRFLIDAHFDEIGMLTTQILDGGFLRVTGVGGIDDRILQGAEVYIYGKETIYGVITAISPHLQTVNTLSLTPMKELFVDTGYTKEYLEKIISVGSPVGFKYNFKELLNNKVCGKGFDDKICAAAAIKAADILSGTDFDAELTVMLSAGEEVSYAVIAGTYNVKPDYAIVLDVCNANVPGTDLKKGVSVGGGADISISAVTAPKLTKKLIECAKKNEIPHSVTVEGGSTGTNANDIPLVGEGIPTVLISIPLKNMHTYSEVGSLDDAENVAKLCAEFILELNKGDK